MKEETITLVYCSSSVEGVLYAATFNHLTEWDAMQAACNKVREMAQEKKGRSWSMGDASYSHLVLRKMKGS